MDKETIEIDLGFCPLNQAVMDKLVGKCNASDANSKTIIIRNVVGYVPRLIVDYGDILPVLAQAVKVLSDKLNLKKED